MITTDDLREKSIGRKTVKRIEEIIDEKLINCVSENIRYLVVLYSPKGLRDVKDYIESPGHLDIADKYFLNLNKFLNRDVNWSLLIVMIINLYSRQGYEIMNNDYEDGFSEYIFDLNNFVME